MNRCRRGNPSVFLPFNFVLRDLDILIFLLNVSKMCYQICFKGQHEKKTLQIQILKSDAIYHPSTPRQSLTMFNWLHSVYRHLVLTCFNLLSVLYHWLFIMTMAYVTRAVPWFLKSLALSHLKAHEPEQISCAYSNLTLANRCEKQDGFGSSESKISIQEI